MKRFATLFLILLAAVSHAALNDLDNPGPAIHSASARQRYPWNGLVDVDVSFTGNADETYRIELSATDKTGGTNLPVRTAWLEGAPAAVGNPVDVPAPGTHRLVWNAGADLPAGFVADRVTVAAKLLNPIWSFESIPEIDQNDEWAPQTVYHDVQTVASYGEIENHEPTVRCLTDEWNLEASLGANVVFSGASMGLRQATHSHPEGWSLVSLWTWSDATNRYRMVTLDYETGEVCWDNAASYETAGADVRFFQMRDGDGRQFADVCRVGYDAFWKSASTDIGFIHLQCRYADAEHGSAVCGYFPNGIPVSSSTGTSVSSYDKSVNVAVFFSGGAGTDLKEAVVTCGSTGSLSVQTTSKYSCMGNPVGRYVVPLLDGNTFFTVGYPADVPCAVQNFGLCVGRFTRFDSWDFSFCASGNYPKTAWSKGVAMPNGTRIFLGGAGHATNGRCRMWQGSNGKDTFFDYPAGHPFESWARRDVTCLLPNGKFCGVDEELGLVVVNPLTGETYVASDDPVFKKGKMGCQLLPNGKVWIIPYDCEGREFEAGLAICGKLYEVDFGFTRSFSLSSLCSPYLKVAEGDPEPSGIKVGLDPNGGSLPGIYAQYYKGTNPVYGELPVPTWTGHTFLGWSTDGTAAGIVAATDPVPALGILLKAAWTANTYTVTFDRQSGSGGSASVTATYGSAMPSITAPTRTGYAFGGYYTAANGGGTQYYTAAGASARNWDKTAATTLYAKWTANSYSVKFNKNASDATGTMSNESFTYGTAKALTANAFTRTGYIFAGWATSATGAKAYNDKQSVSNLTTTSGGTVNLYAVWTKALYMVIDLSSGSSSSKYPVSYLTAVPNGGWSDEYKTTKLVLRRINAGTFTMGSPSGEVGRYGNETQHSVTLTKDYFIGVFEVTQRQWELVMGTKPSYFSNATYYKTRPVERISYNAIRGSSTGAGWPSSSGVDSSSFIGCIRSRTGLTQFDLPTETQWEFACRAGTTTAVSNGINLNNAEYDSRISNVCWHYQDYTAASPSSGWGYGTMPVGEQGANPWGLYDMHGNVWEWCLDWYMVNLGTSAVTDPKGPSSGSHRVIRSGAWECASYNCRSARRGDEPPSATKRSDSASNGHFGFRLAITP